MGKVVIEVPQGQVAKVNKQADGNISIIFEEVKYYLNYHSLLKDNVKMMKMYNILKDKYIKQ